MINLFKKFYAKLLEEQSQEELKEQGQETEEFVKGQEETVEEIEPKIIEAIEDIEKFREIHLSFYERNDLEIENKIKLGRETFVSFIRYFNFYCDFLILLARYKLLKVHFDRDTHNFTFTLFLYYNSIRKYILPTPNYIKDCKKNYGLPLRSTFCPALIILKKNKTLQVSRCNIPIFNKKKFVCDLHLSTSDMIHSAYYESSCFMEDLTELQLQTSSFDDSTYIISNLTVFNDIIVGILYRGLSLFTYFADGDYIHFKSFKSFYDFFISEMEYNYDIIGRSTLHELVLSLNKNQYEEHKKRKDARKLAKEQSYQET